MPPYLSTAVLSLVSQRRAAAMVKSKNGEGHLNLPGELLNLGGGHLNNVETYSILVKIFSNLVEALSILVEAFSNLIEKGSDLFLIFVSFLKQC